jgi:hypothetical protein
MILAKKIDGNQLEYVQENNYTSRETDLKVKNLGTGIY